MPITASPELVALCQSQLMLLNRAFGAVSAIIYLAETAAHAEQPRFTPIARYPEACEDWPLEWHPETVPAFNALPASTLSAGLSAESSSDTAVDASLTDAAGQSFPLEPAIEPLEAVQATSASGAAALQTRSAQPTFEADAGQQLVLPLIYSEVVVGMMVMIRHDRAWQPEERHQLQSVAHGIAAGCFLEQRQQWLHQRLQSKRALQGRQSEVFHNLLHQFRNPLTALGTFGKLLLRRLQRDDPNYAIADNMVRESKRLQTLVEDFNQTVDLGDADLQEDLRAARGLLPAALTDSAIAVVSVDPPGADQTVAPAGRLLPVKGLGRSLTLTEQSLPELLDPLIAVTQAVAQEQQVDFRVAVEPTTPAVIADRQALQEVVANLLDNAVKYSPAQARVWVQTGLERRVSGKDYVGILVGDTGPGIPAEDRAQLFQRHYRGVQTTGPIGGTGLGLAIAKDLVTQMHGVIEVFSPAATTPGQGYPSHQEGPGTVFIVWLPKAG